MKNIDKCQLIKEAKQRYPIGSKIHSLYFYDITKEIETDEFRVDYRGDIYVLDKNGKLSNYVFLDGVWAVRQGGDLPIVKQNKWFVIFIMTCYMASIYFVIAFFVNEIDLFEWSTNAKGLFGIIFILYGYFFFSNFIDD